jgi:hypothetical protein
MSERPVADDEQGYARRRGRTGCRQRILVLVEAADPDRDRLRLVQPQLGARVSAFVVRRQGVDLDAVRNHHGARGSRLSDRSHERLALARGDADRPIGGAEQRVEVEARRPLSRSFEPPQQVQAVQGHDRRARGEERQAQPCGDLALDVYEVVAAARAKRPDDAAHEPRLRTRVGREVDPVRPVALHARKQVDVRLAAAARMREDVQDASGGRHRASSRAARANASYSRK